MRCLFKFFPQVLIEKYSKRCKGNFASLEDDAYIYWKLIDHLVSADMVGKAIDLLLDFSWITAKLRATGAPDLINNYHQVKGLVNDEVILGPVHTMLETFRFGFQRQSDTKF